MKELAPLLMMMTAAICNHTYGHHVYPADNTTAMTLTVPKFPWLQDKLHQWLAYEAEHPTPVTSDQPDIFTQNLVMGDPMLTLDSINQVFEQAKPVQRTAQTRETAANHQPSATEQ